MTKALIGLPIERTWFKSCAALISLGNFIHSTLLQFTRLYERVLGQRQLCMKILCALTTVWLNISQKVEICLIQQVCQGKIKSSLWIQQDTALYKNLSIL